MEGVRLVIIFIYTGETVFSLFWSRKLRESRSKTFHPCNSVCKVIFVIVRLDQIPQTHGFPDQVGE